MNINKLQIVILILIMSLINSCSTKKSSADQYLFSSDIEKKWKQDTIWSNFDSYAIDYINIGEYKKSLEMVNIIQKSKVRRYKKAKKKSNIDTAYFNNFKPVNAVKEILNQAENHQIIIINEEHNSPQNRLFTSILLEGLSKKGFTYFFAETLNPDTNLNKEKYPTQSSGFLIKEPQYGNLIRNALKLGYTVLPYEAKEDKKEKDFIKRLQSRETGQALNIKKTIDKNPKAKIVIHCGRSHLTEEYLGIGLGMMGAVLKKETGIDPFTIDQFKLIERFTNEAEHPFRVYIDKNPPNEASLFINDKGEYFNLYKNEKPWDAVVYFPETQYINGRPNWLLMDKNNKFVNIPFNDISIKRPYLVFAYYENEDISNAIPADIIEIEDEDDKKSLVLQAANYKLIIRNSQGEIEKIKMNVH